MTFRGAGDLLFSSALSLSEERVRERFSGWRWHHFLAFEIEVLVNYAGLRCTSPGATFGWRRPLLGKERLGLEVLVGFEHYDCRRGHAFAAA